MKLKILLPAILLAATLLSAGTSSAQSNLPPTIISQPQNVLATNGATPAFNVSVTGTAPLAFQWQFKGTNFPGINGNYPATGSNLVLFKASITNAGPYDVVITNAFGSVTSSVATLTIAFPPAITNQPVSQVVTNVKTVTFSVGAAGTGPFTYQWLFNGKLLTNNIITTVAGGGGKSPGYSGDGGTATNASLNQPSAVVVDANGNLFIADKLNHRIREVTASGIITTVAGNGTASYNGNGNVATNSSLNQPAGVAVNANGGLFVADTENQRIRTTLFGLMVNVAGTGSESFGGDNGPAYNAILNQPAGVAVDASGNIFIADTYNNRIRKVDANDVITTVAGNGTFRYSGDGGMATNASLYQPAGVAVDASGNLFIADTYNNRIRKVGTNGIITTIAGVNSTGNLGDGGPATNAFLNRPAGVAVDSYGNIFIADTFDERIRKVSPAGIITTVAGKSGTGYSGDGGAATNAMLYEPSSVAVDAAGDLFIADMLNSRIRKVTPPGPILTVPNVSSLNAGNYQVIISSAFGSVTSSVAVLTVDLPPAILQPPISQSVVNGSNATFNVAAAGSLLSYQWQFNGTNLPASGNFFGSTNASLTLFQVTTNNAGNYDVIIGNLWGSVTSSVARLTITYPPAITNQPVSTTIVNGQNTTFTVGVTGTGPLAYRWLLNGTNLPAGIITTMAGSSSAGYSGDGGAATNANLYGTYGVAVDASGNLFIADTDNQRIRKVDTNGIITTVAGNGTAGYSGDGNQATNASLNQPYSVAVDGHGNLFISDTYNNVIRRVDTNGIISTFTGNGSGGFSGDGGGATNATLNYPSVICLDTNGNLYIADTSNHRIRKVDAQGIISTVAGNGQRAFAGDGGAATNASLYYPGGITVDASGNLFIADTGNQRIRQVDATGLINTIAGSGLQGFSGDGGPASNASLNQPDSVAVDAAGNLFIADWANQRIRKVDASGFISTVAGSGNAGYSGDGGPAINASLRSPDCVVLDSTGNLFIADSLNSVIRKVSLSGTYATLTLNNVTTNNAGNYQVIVTSPWGSVTSSIVSLNVVFPPAITSQPTSQSILNGSNATFNVTASGTTPLSYQWQLNGVNLADDGNLSGSGTNMLFLNQATATNGGVYDVVITNPWGSVTSSVVALTIVYPPAIISQPANQYVLTSSNTMFSVSATGTGPLSYQWQFNGLNLTDGGSLSGSTSNTLALTLVTTNNAGNYDVIVTSAWGSVTSSVAGLTIVYPPALTSQPLSQTIINGSNALFGVTATGTAPLSYQWRFNGFNVAYGGNLSGSLTNTLLLTQVTTNNAGLYDVIIANAWGSVTSSVAALTIVFPPVIVSQPAPQTIVNGGSGQFKITASGTAPLNYQWRHSGTNLTDNAFFSGTTTTNLALAQVSTNLAGNYDVIATSAWGGVTSSVAALTIAFPPAITNPPVSQSLILSNSTVFKVGATGTAPLHYQWQFNGTNLPNIGNPSDTTSSSMNIKPVLAGNAGNYDVVITNAWGSVTSSVVTLTVYFPPVITSQPAGLVITNTKTVTFNVSAAGTGPLSYQWLFNGRLLSNNVITTIAGKGTQGYSGDGGAATNAALYYPYGVTADDQGNVFIADTFNNRIRKVNANGSITTVAGNGNAGYNGNGLLATNSSLNSPYGVAVDADGNLFIADTSNQRLRAVIYGTMITVAGNGAQGNSGDGGLAYNTNLVRPSGVAVDMDGNLFIAESLNNRVRKVDDNDIITTLAGHGIPGASGFSGDGGAATNASMYNPSGVAVDAFGNVFIVDSSNHRIRKVDTNGIITTVAGGNNLGFSGDGGQATNATLNLGNPSGVAVDAYGDLYIADTYNQRIRMVNPLGIITTVAGRGPLGFTGDGGSATNATLYNPSGVAVDAAGNLFIADTYNERIRLVTPTGPSLTLVNASATNAGNYQVIVSSAYGSVTSSVALLQVNQSPAITQQPASQSVMSGGNATFSVAAAGGQSLRYQWLFNGANQAGQTTASFALNGITLANAGAYQVVITNSYGSVTSSIATLTVSLPGVIAVTTTNGGITLNLLTAPNVSSRLLAATNLIPPVIWQPVSTNVPGISGFWQFTDTNTSQYPARYYRTATP